MDETPDTYIRSIIAQLQQPSVGTVRKAAQAHCRAWITNHAAHFDAIDSLFNSHIQYQDGYMHQPSRHAEQDIAGLEENYFLRLGHQMHMVRDITNNYLANISQKLDAACETTDPQRALKYFKQLESFIADSDKMPKAKYGVNLQETVDQLGEMLNHVPPDEGISPAARECLPALFEHMNSYFEGCRHFLPGMLDTLRPEIERAAQAAKQGMAF